jgi:hypothetical protein
MMRRTKKKCLEKNKRLFPFLALFENKSNVQKQNLEI